MRRMLPALALLGLTVCEEPSLSLEFGNGPACAAIALEVVDEALLPGWTITAMAAEGVEDAGAWIVARDPEGRSMLQAWPTGAGIDLSPIGDAAEFELQPGAIEGESWLALDRPAGMRVWRLGPAERGAVDEVAGLADFPGPGDWTRRLLFVGDTPYVLAVPVATTDAVPRFYIAAIDRAALTLGPASMIDFTQMCEGSGPTDCAYPAFARGPVDILAVTAAGSMRGGAALLAMGSPQPDYPIGRDVFITVLMLHEEEAGGPPLAEHSDLGLIAGTSGLAGTMRGQLAADGRFLFMATWLLSPDVKIPLNGVPVGALDLDASAARQAWTGWTLANMLLQLGTRAVIGGIAEGQLTLAPFGRDGVDTAITGSLALAPDTRVTSIGREQLLLRPGSGPARRVRARCVPAG